ncbi:MAG: hypothetical protein O7C56_07470, partial [Rickettsia endosymbiont of Ixodes persulcatus]|nr:hypothetical protein [Rickettsia endosymbiont of Ixodes persulcatus]
MAGYPRNNLHEQLAMKNSSVNGSTGRSAREQAGLAREMSGIGQYVGALLLAIAPDALLKRPRQMKPAFSYACEGSARVPAANSRRQPISLESSASSSTIRSVPAAQRNNSATAASRPAVQVGNSRKQTP